MEKVLSQFVAIVIGSMGVFQIMNGNIAWSIFDFVLCLLNIYFFVM
jgi:TM2 domain-containing membrane protein YozV